MSRPSARRRVVDRSLQLLGLTVALYAVVYVGYRGLTGIHSSDPMAAVVTETQVLLEALPSSHHAREELTELSRQATALARGEVIEAPKPKEFKAEAKPADGATAAKGEQTPVALPTEPVKSKDELFAERKVEVAGGLMRVIDGLQDDVDRAALDIESLEKRIAAGETAGPPKEDAEAAPAADATPASGEGDETATAPVVGDDADAKPLPEQLATARAELTAAQQILPAASGLRPLALWLADEPRWAFERHQWATYWAMVAAAAPTAVAFWLLIRGRKLPLEVPDELHLPATSVRRREQERDLRQGVLASYFLHALPIILSMISLLSVYRLGPPGGGGSVSGAPQAQEEVKVVKVQRKKYMLNPFSSVFFNAPKEIDEDLEEATHRPATAAGGGKVGGEGEGEGAGYEGGVGDGQIHFVVINHGGSQWDQVVPVAAPALLREFRARVGVPTATAPTVVRVSDLAAQRDPAQQPPLVYMSMDGSGHRLNVEDLRWLQKYCREYAGMILIDDISGGRGPAEDLARKLFPGKPLVPIPKDDLLFRIRVPMAEADRALAKHGGDRILGVKDQDRWVLVYHPGDLVDGWRKAYGVKWQESSFQFGINCWDYAAKHFTRRLRKKK